MEWLYSLLPSEVYYNITVFLSILCCEKTWPDQSEVSYERDSTENIVEILQKEKVERGLLEYISSLFNTLDAQNSQRTINFDNEDNKPETYIQNHCQPFSNFNFNQSISFDYLASFCAVAIILTLIIWLISKLFNSKYKALKIIQTSQEVLVAETDESVSATNNFEKNESRESASSETVNKSLYIQPLVIDIQNVNPQQFTYCKHNPELESVFEETVYFFFKELNQSLGIEMSLPTERGDLGTSLPASSLFDAIVLSSPVRARRGLQRNHNSAQSFIVGNSCQRKVSETSSKYWISFQKFRRQMSWLYPDINFDDVDFEHFSKAENRLSSIVQFLHQRCSIRPRQWNAATCLIDYTLFLLEYELKALSNESSELLKFIGFEGTGSAMNGTMAGTADRFDVLFVNSISKCSKITVLHNKFNEDISPGHIILGVEQNDDNSTRARICCHKACIQGLSSLYLLPQQVEDIVEALIKKAILKLHRELKNKTDSLPFKFQMSHNNKLMLSFDTKLLQDLGLGIGEISVKFIPVISIFVPHFGILPPVYAVPGLRTSKTSTLDSNSASSNFLSSIIRNQSHADLLWEISAEKLHMSIVQNIENKCLLSGVRSYHRECLIILKALFSKGTENNLLNKGEIDANVLDTVVSFLFQESPPSAWTLDNIPDRISDAVHFLKSAYQNMLLPKFMIHNPHLFAQIPSLEAMSSLLCGRQQNMLAHITSDETMKVLDYIDQRLQQTGLNRYIKPEFSSHLWEYEFFLFG